MRRIWFGCLFAICSIGVTYHAGHAQISDGVNTEYVSSDSYLLIRFHPSQMLEYANDAEFTQQMIKEIENETALEVASIDEVTIQLGQTDEGGFDDDAMTIVIRCSKAIDLDEFTNHSFSSNEKTTHNGRPLYIAENEYAPHIYFPDDRTIVMGVGDRLLETIDAPQSMGGMVDLVRNTNPESEFVLVFDRLNAPEMILQMMFGMSADFGELTLLEMIQRTELIVAEGSLLSDRPLEGTITAISPDAAEELEESVRAMLQMGKIALPILKAQAIEGFASDDEKEFFEDAIDALITLVSELETSRDADKVLIELEHEGGLPDLVNLVGATLFARGGSAPPPEAVDSIKIDR